MGLGGCGYLDWRGDQLALCVILSTSSMAISLMLVSRKMCGLGEFMVLRFEI